MRIIEPDGSERIKTFGPGDHWGERILEAECLTTGGVTALEDGVVLVFKRDAFQRFRSAFHGMG